TQVLAHHAGGQPLADDTTRRGEIFDPASGRVVRHVPLADAAMVDRVVGIARDAFGSWRESTLAQRTRVLFSFRELVAGHLDELAALIVGEHGKVHADAVGEVQRGLEVVEFACGVPHLLKGGFSENVSTGVDSYSIRQPL